MQGNKRPFLHTQNGLSEVKDEAQQSNIQNVSVKDDCMNWLGKLRFIMIEGCISASRINQEQRVKKVIELRDLDVLFLFLFTCPINTTQLVTKCMFLFNWSVSLASRRYYRNASLAGRDSLNLGWPGCSPHFTHLTFNQNSTYENSLLI